MQVGGISQDYETAPKDHLAALVSDYVAAMGRDVSVAASYYEFPAFVAGPKVF